MPERLIAGLAARLSIIYSARARAAGGGRPATVTHRSGEAGQQPAIMSSLDAVLPSDKAFNLVAMDSFAAVRNGRGSSSTVSIFTIYMFMLLPLPPPSPPLLLCIVLAVAQCIG